MNTNARIIYGVVLMIGFIAAGSTMGLFALAFAGRDPPDALNAIATTAIGALAGLLAKTSTQSETGETVNANIVNTPKNPANVKEAEDAASQDMPPMRPEEGEPPDVAGSASAPADVTPSPIRPEQGVFYDPQTGTLTVPANGPATNAPATKGTL